MAESKKKIKINLLQFLVLLSLMGIVLAILLTSSVNFKNMLLNILYPKPKSFASELGTAPSVDLKVSYNNQIQDGAVNVPLEDATYTLSWETRGSPTSCIGRAWGGSDIDETFKGAKDVNGGSFVTKKLNQNNPYTYMIDCKNASGDASGDSITLNVGAQNGNLPPYITELNVDIKSIVFDNQSEISAHKGDGAQINFTTLNTKTPYSVCLATGSWPTIYKDLGENNLSEQFVLDISKIYSFRIYCSNETSYTQKNVSFFVK